jgi:hypothetical protein
MADQGNPPRPGDPVPNEGLDPTQVFGSPPPPPQQSAQGDQGAQPPQDTSPPPPPVGTVATKEMGYDDEDIKILGEVGNYRFGTIADALSNENIAPPAHPDTNFDDQRFLTLLRGSISLTRDEKWRIIQAIPKLSQFQIDELQKILSEEREKFEQLSPKHLKHLMQLEKKHSEDWKDLQSIFIQGEAKQKEQSQADEIRKQLGL